MTAPLLKIEHLEVRYGDLIGVSDVSLEVPEGSVVALLGSNGGGKTTMLNAIAGLIPRSAGRSRFAARRSAVSRPLRSCARALRCRRRAGGYSCSRASRTTCCSAPPRSTASRARDLLDRVYAIFPKLAERRSQRAGTMSGGERQMLAVGRALMSDPQAADAGRAVAGSRADDRRGHVRDLAQLHKTGLTILLAEQSIELALEVSDFATVLQVGRNAMSGLSKDLANDPNVQKVYLGL